MSDTANVTSNVTSPADALSEFSAARDLQQRGEWQQARTLYLALADRPPLYAACQYQLALIAIQHSSIEEAIERLQRALAAAPGDPAILETLVTVLEASGRTADALGAALQLALALQTRGDSPRAFALYQRMLSMDPLCYAAWINLGVGLALAGDIDAAVRHLVNGVRLIGRVIPKVEHFAGGLCERLGEAGFTLFPPLPPGVPNGSFERLSDALTSLGKGMSDLGFHTLAVDCHRVAIELEPAHQLAHWNLALALLALGEFEEGWQETEWRWMKQPPADPLRWLPIPRWNGKTPENRQLLIYAEQGFGDTLQFAPLVQQLAQRARHVVFQVHPSLVRLLAYNLDSERLEVAPMPQDPNTPGTERPVETFAAQLSLPHFMGLKRSDLPLQATPLRALPEDVAAWTQRLPTTAARKLGIVWAGRPEHGNDRNRSLPVEQLESLLQFDHAQWISLQIGPRAAEFARLAPQGVDLMQEVRNFADTAAIIHALDLVIAVDTSVAHLAAAMGKPVWLLLPFICDWRWGASGEHSDWYPQLRLFRQPCHGDWAGVIASVRHALDGLR